MTGGERLASRVVIGLLLDHLGVKIKITPAKTELFTGKHLADAKLELIEKEDETEEPSFEKPVLI